MSVYDYDEIEEQDKARSRCEEPTEYERVPDFYLWVIRPDDEMVIYHAPTKDIDGYSQEDRWSIMLDKVDAEYLEPLPLPKPFMWQGEECSVWVDEEGLLNDKQPNFKAMEVVDWQGIMPLVGNVVIVPDHMIE
jgi:hypothetical protein